MKLLLMFILLYSFNGYCQEEKAVKYHVEYYELKVAAQGGGMTDWRVFGNLNNETDEYFTINLTKKTIVYDFKLKEMTQREFHTYHILDVEYDKKLKVNGSFEDLVKELITSKPSKKK